MNFASAYSLWWEVGLLLTIVTSGIVACAYLAEWHQKSAAAHRAVWQVALVAVLVTAVVEMTGTRHLAAQWLRVAWPETGHTTPPADAVTAEARRLDTLVQLSQSAPGVSPDFDRPMRAMPADPALPLPTSDAIVPGDQRVWDLYLESALRDTAAGSGADRLRSEPAAAHSSSDPLRATCAALPGPPPNVSPVKDTRPTRGPVVWPGVVWLAGSGLVSVYILLGYAALAVFRLRTQPLADAELQHRADRLAGRLGIRGHVRVLQSRRLRTPVAFGVLRPTIALPANFRDQFDQDQREAILAHELAHLAAGDPAWQWSANLVTALLWWQPAIWFLRRRLQSASEMAADEATLVLPAGPEHLAASLVEIGRRLVERPRLGWVPMTGDGYRSNLGRRVGRLLKLETHRHEAPRRPPAVWIRCSIVLLLVFSVVLGSAWICPRAALAEGESTMTKLKMTWSRSLAAAAIAMVLGPLAGDGPAADTLPDGARLQPPADVQVALLQDDREQREREEAERGEREAEEREERREREAEEREERERDERHREEREREERERVLHDLEREQDELLERAAHLKRELADLPDDADEEYRNLRGELEEIEHAVRRVKEELEQVRRGGRREGEAREHPEELLRAMMREREELMGLGRKVMRELEEFKRSGNERAAREAAEKLEQIKREVAGLEDRAREVQGRRGPRDQHRPGPEEVERRLHHLRVAAENLHAAGLHEQAEQLMREAERIAHHGPPPEHREMPPVEHMERALHDLHRQMDEMRGQMEEMKRALKMLMERERR